MERQTPHSLEAEQATLGCIFLSPNECMGLCIEKLKMGEAVFYDLRHQVIYKLLLDMTDKREAIDIITVQRRLVEQNELAAIGGIPYLATLPDTTPSAANLSFYLNILLEKYVCRKMLFHGYEFADRVYEHTGEIDSLVHDFESSALAIAEHLLQGEQANIKELTKARLGFYEDCLARGGSLLGLSSGYPDLDRMLNGLVGGDMIVIAARPSLGKTSLAMNIAERVALGQKCPVGVFSLEMKAESLVGRLIACRANVNERTLIRGAATEAEMVRVANASMAVASAPIHIDDTPGMTVSQMRAKARRMLQQHGLKLLIIDYLQLLRTAKRRDSRREEVDEISNGVKACARELNVPVIVICQLNREVEKDKERKPRISDLRESGQIEQDADVIGLLYNADQEAAARNELILPVNLLIAKQRNGPTGDVPFVFFKETGRFESVSKMS